MPPRERQAITRAAVLAGLALAIAAAVSAGGTAQAFSPPPQSAPLPLEAYWLLVEDTHALMADLHGRPPEISHLLLSARAARWEAIDTVILPDGTLVPVQHSFLVSRLRAYPPDLPALEAQLTCLLAAREAWPPVVRTAADIAPLTEILARPEFQWPETQPSPLAVWLDRLWQRIDEFFVNLLPKGGSSLALRYALTGLGLVALAAVLYYALRGVLGDLVMAQDSEQEEAGQTPLTAATALKRGHALANGGDYRAAVRYLYLSALLLLEEHGLLRYDRTRTNREYLRSVAHLPRLAKPLQQVVQVFEQVWYGFQPLDEAAYRQYTAWVEELRRQR